MSDDSLRPGTPVDLVMWDAVKNRYRLAEIDRTKRVLYVA